MEVANQYYENDKFALGHLRDLLIEVLLSFLEDLDLCYKLALFQNNNKLGYKNLLSIKKGLKKRLTQDTQALENILPNVNNNVEGGVLC